MNGFGPVILDFPYAFELDGAKLQCRKLINTPNGLQPCGGEIDYDAGFDYLVCTKCGRKYQAKDLAANNKDILVMNDKGGEPIMSKVRLVAYRNGKKEVVLDDNTSSKTYVSKEEYNQYNNDGKMPDVVEVARVNKRRRLSREKKIDLTYNNFMIKKLNKESSLEYKPFSKLLPSIVEVEHNTNNRDNDYDNEIELHNRKTISVKIEGCEYQEETIKDIEEPVCEEKDTVSNNEMIKDAEYNKDYNTTEEDDEESPQYNNDRSSQKVQQEQLQLNLSELGANFIGSKADVEEQDYSNYIPEEESEDDDNINNNENDIYTYEDYLSDKDRKRTKFKTNKLDDSDLDNY